jgi:pimeloyl-ACP methyl ester carboxylesterase
MIEIQPRQITLRDRRRLGYSEWGDPAGKPVIVAHGIPSSRLFRHPDESIALGLGVRLITVDRPGIGSSDLKPNRTILDWVDDLQQLADSLNLAQFAMLGVSGGGPYAAAVAAKLAPRISRLALVSAFGPIAEAEVLATIPGVAGSAYRFMLSSPGLARLTSQAQALQISTLVKMNPSWYVSLTDFLMTDGDREVFKQVVGLKEMFEKDIQEVYRINASGQIHDSLSLLQPWGFSLKDVRVPTHLWQGDIDPNVPFAMGQYMASQLPNCVPHYCPGEGHLLIFTHWHEILSALSA